MFLSGPVFSTSFSARAALEVSSPKRLAVKFQEGQIATPKLISDLEFPSSVTVLGQSIDLTRLKVCPAQHFTSSHLESKILVDISSIGTSSSDGKALQFQIDEFQIDE